MIDSVRFNIVGAVGTGKAKILTLLRNTLVVKGYCPSSTGLKADKVNEITALVERDIRDFKLLERIDIVTKRQALNEPFDSKTLKLWVETSLSHSICAEIYMEVIKPTFEAIEGLGFTYDDVIKNHLSNPAIFPLRMIHWDFHKAYPVTVK